MRILRRLWAACCAFVYVLRHGAPVKLDPADRFVVVSDEATWSGNDMVEASRRIERARSLKQAWSYYVDGVMRKNG